MRAQKEFLKLVPPHDSSAKSTIDGFKQDPRPHAVKKLAGTKNGYRIRVGNYPLPYTIDDREKIVTVYRIRRRREAYR